MVVVVVKWLSGGGGGGGGYVVVLWPQLGGLNELPLLPPDVYCQ